MLAKLRCIRSHPVSLTRHSIVFTSIKFYRYISFTASIYFCCLSAYAYVTNTSTVICCCACSSHRIPWTKQAKSYILTYHQPGRVSYIAISRERYKYISCNYILSLLSCWAPSTTFDIMFSTGKFRISTLQEVYMRFSSSLLLTSVWIIVYSIS